MSRNERRIAGKTLEKKTGIKTAPIAASAKAQDFKNQGMAMKAAGRDAEAIPLLTEALKADPSLADVHFTLAVMARTKPELKLDIDAVNRSIRDKATLCKSYLVILNILKGRKQYAEALICQEELCRLMPDNQDEKANLALLHNLGGTRTKALEIFAELMRDHPETKKYKGLFLSIMGPVVLQEHNVLLVDALQSAFGNIYEANLSKVFPVWIRLIMNHPSCRDLQTVEKLITQAEFDQWAEKNKLENCDFLTCPLFIDGIRLLIITDTVLELFLTRMRRWMCLNASKLANENRLESFVPFLCALGEQCFFNEYIFIQDKQEQDAIAELIKTGPENAGNITPAQYFALISCYQPLIDAFPDNAELFVTVSQKSPSFSQLVNIQFNAPIEEAAIRNRLESFGTLQDFVSQKVQQQYEEHPYPRWNSLNNYPLPNDDLPFVQELRMKPYRILVAGCGTGRHAIGTAACYPNAHVTAIDLSRASLAYAQRKATESGLGNRLRFIHADILEMKDWDGEFDIIESSGVLHHMNDPFKGWQTLNNLLIPGGYFKVGLYSELAREQIVEARNFVAQGGYAPTDEGIRQCRADILALPSSNPMRKKLISFTDFFSTSLLRDLIFHVQEHRMTLPQIDGMMQQLGLSCISVNMTIPEIVTRFDKMFPQDIHRCNLMNWHEFEQKFPETFSGMYQFWCQKQT